MVSPPGQIKKSPSEIRRLSELKSEADRIRLLPACLSMGVLEGVACVALGLFSMVRQDIGFWGFAVIVAGFAPPFVIFYLIPRAFSGIQLTSGGWKFYRISLLRAAILGGALLFLMWVQQEAVLKLFGMKYGLVDAIVSGFLPALTAVLFVGFIYNRTSFIRVKIAHAQIDPDSPISKVETSHLSYFHPALSLYVAVYEGLFVYCQIALIPLALSEVNDGRFLFAIFLWFLAGAGAAGLTVIVFNYTQKFWKLKRNWLEWI